MKTRVVVTLVATTDVEIDVEHEENEDPTDLNPEERQRAINEAFMAVVDWEVEDVDEA